MYHYKARVYSPYLGRMMQTDPSGYEGGINLYAYVGNDPVNLVDPTGTISICQQPGFRDCDPGRTFLAQYSQKSSANARRRRARRDQAAAEAIYGETAGLYPGLIDEDGSQYNPRNWDPRSADQLTHARRAIGIISERNNDINRRDGSSSRNPIEAAQWSQAMATAQTRHTENIPRNARLMYIRNMDAHPRAFRNFPGAPRAVYSGTFGRDAPFRNVGGGDVRAGNNIVIDIYLDPDY